MFDLGMDLTGRKSLAVEVEKVVMEKSLKGSVALVTGASGGIGSEISRRLARMGAGVALHYHQNAESAKALEAEAVFRENGAVTVQADLTREDDVARMWQTIEARLGPVKTLICNAGYLKEEAVPLQKMSLSQWQTTQERNVLPYFLCMREFFRRLAIHPFHDPSAVLVASMSGMWGQPYHCDYAAAKAAATHGILPSLKDEIVRIAPQGRVNAVAPGFIKTAMVENKMKNREVMTQVLQTASLRKFGTPADVASAVAFLASPALSGHITGEIIRLAGGKEGRVLFEMDEINW